MKHLTLAKKNREVDPKSWDQLYKSEINRRIRMRYSVDDELSLTYVERCKAEVKAILKEGDTSENNNV